MARISCEKTTTKYIIRQQATYKTYVIQVPVRAAGAGGAVAQDLLGLGVRPHSPAVPAGAGAAGRAAGILSSYYDIIHHTIIYYKYCVST